MIEEFLEECSVHGLPVENFGHKSNARNFINWKFAPAPCDVRMPLIWDDEDFDDMADVLVESCQTVLKRYGMM
jgi:hypothetical protein